MKLDEKVRVPKAPCPECPFRRTSTRGWLGEGRLDYAKTYMQHALGDHDISCHMQTANSCAGLATFRRNICKTPRDPQVAAVTQAVQPDRETIFATPQQFLDHHTITDEAGRLKVPLSEIKP